MRVLASERAGRRTCNFRADRRNRIQHFFAALGVLLLGAGAAQAQSGPYQSTASATINNAVACPASISRQIHVAESFTISDLDVGFLATHTYRSDIQLELTPPWGGSPVRLLQGLGYSGLGYDNYNVLLNDESSTLVNTGFHASNDNASAPPYQNDVRPNNPLSAFDGNNAQGDWTLTICDTYGPLDNGEFLQADLFFNRIDLSLTKTVSTPTPAAGANFTYTITVSNAGPSAATGVSVKDALPTGITHVSDSGAGAYVPATGIWTIAGSIAPGTSRSLTITANAAYNGSYTNTAEVYTAAGGDMDSTPNNSASAPSEDDTASVAVTVSGGPPAPPMCQPGLLLINSSGNALSQTNTGVITPDRAVGGLTPAGTSPPDPYAALLNQSSDELVLDLGVDVPQNAQILISAARNGGSAGNTARVDIETSADGLSYAFVGSYGAAPATFVSPTRDVLERFSITVPSGGARYLRFRTQDNDDIFIDGVEYSQVCRSSPTLLASKSVSMVATSGAASFAIPGSDVYYTITVTNAGSGSADVDSIFIADPLPAQVDFFNGDIDGAGPATGAAYFTESGSGLTFTPGSDLRYSSAASPPATFAACTYSAAAGYDPNVRYVCLNPKGQMLSGSPDPTFSIKFRARIK